MCHRDLSSVAAAFCKPALHWEWFKPETGPGCYTPDCFLQTILISCRTGIENRSRFVPVDGRDGGDSIAAGNKVIYKYTFHLRQMFPEHQVAGCTCKYNGRVSKIIPGRPYFFQYLFVCRSIACPVGRGSATPKQQCGGGVVLQQEIITPDYKPGVRSSNLASGEEKVLHLTLFTGLKQERGFSC